MKKFSGIVFQLVMVLGLGLFAQSSDFVAEQREPAAKKTSTSRIHDILIEGNRKIESDAIMAVIKSKKEESLDASQVKSDIQSIFNLGFFADIQVHKESTSRGIILKYKVVEKPSIVQVHFHDNDEINDEELVETIDIKNYEILKISKIKEAQEKIQKAYEDKGFFLAEVKYEIKALKEGETVAVHFNIKENAKVKVKELKLIGNKELSSNLLKSRMATQEGGLFSFISSSGSYKQEMFDRDIHSIVFSYFNEGFLDVKVDRPEVSISADKKFIFITIRITEGEKYKIGNVDFFGDLLFEEEKLKQTVKIDEEEYYKHNVRLQDVEALQKLYGDMGYAYTNILPRTRTYPDEKKIDIRYEIDKGYKVYFGEINISGNTKTRDKVVRRELKIFEGELYNETNKRESIAAVKRLGYFEDVNFKTSSDPNNQEVMDVEIVVKERQTGSLQMGAGFSTGKGFMFNAQISEQNLFGKGQKLSLNLQHTQVGQTYTIGLTEPYFLDSMWSLGGDIYHRDTEAYETRPYEEIVSGAAIKVGYPVMDFTRLFMKAKIDDTHLTLRPDKYPDDADTTVFPVDTANGLTNSITASLEYDDRDDRMTPKNGIYTGFSYEKAGFSGDLNYQNYKVFFRYYKNIFWDVVWRNNFVHSKLEGEDLPFNKLYLLGGSNNLRGYSYGRVGRRVLNSSSKEVAYGGTQELYYNLEFEFPLIREAKVQGVIFFDMGEAQDSLDTNNDGKINFDDLKKNYGFGFRWFSPIGPLRFEWGFPLDKDDDGLDDDMNFEFAIGSPF